MNKIGVLLTLGNRIKSGGKRGSAKAHNMNMKNEWDMAVKCHIPFYIFLFTLG